MMNYVHRHRRRSDESSRRTRSRSNERKRSTSSEQRHGQCNRQHDHNRRHRHLDADRSKCEMIDQKTILRELQRRYDVSIEKIGRKRVGGSGNDDSTNEGGTWIFLLVSTSIVLASLVTSSSSASGVSVYSSAQRNRTKYLTSLSLCSIQLSLALFGTTFVLCDRFGKHRRSKRTPIHVLTFLSLIIQSITNFLLLGRENYFAVTGLSILNYNMFYGSWVSFGLVSFLSGTVNAAVFRTDWLSFDTLADSNALIVHHRRQFGRQMTVLWTMQLLFQLCTFSSSVSVKISPICSGMLSTTSSCQGVSTALVLSVLNIILCLLCLFGGALSFWRRCNECIVRLYGVVGSLSLILQSVATGILTSEGGMGSNAGNLFITTWTSTVLSLIILIRCIDGYLSSPSSQQDWLERSCVEETEKGSGVMAYPIKNYPTPIMPLPLSVHRSIDTSSTEAPEDDGDKRQQQHKQQGAGAFDNNATARPPSQANVQEKDLPLPALPAVPPASRTNPVLEQKQVRKRPPPPLQQTPMISRESLPINSRPKSDPQGSIPPKNLRRSTESRGIQDTTYYHSSQDIAPSSILEPEDYFTVETRTDSDFVSSAKTFIRKSPSDSYAISDKRRRQPSKSRTGRDPSMVQPSYNSIGNTVVGEEEDTGATEGVASLLCKERKTSQSPVASKPSRQQNDTSNNMSSSHADTASSLLDSGKDSDAYSTVLPTKTDRRSALPPTKQVSKKSLTSSKSDSVTQRQHADTKSLDKKSLVSGNCEGKKSQSSSKTSDDHDALVPPKNSQRSSFPKQSRTKSLHSSTDPIDHGLCSDDTDDSKTAKSSVRQLEKRKIVPNNASYDIASDSDAKIENLAHNDPNCKTTFSASRQSNKASMGAEAESDVCRLFAFKDGQMKKSSVTKKVISAKQPITRKPSFRDKGDSLSSDRRSGIIVRNSQSSSKNTPTSREHSAFDSKVERKVAAEVGSGKAMPAPKRESQPSNVSSTHTPVTTDDEEDSGVETVSTDSDYSSYVKHASSHSLIHSHPDLFPDKGDEAEKQYEHPLDFEFRPTSSSQNFHASFNRRQVLTDFFDPWRQNSAPVQTIRAMDESIISDPTLDNSIRTTKTNKGVLKSDNDEGVRAAIDRATMARKSRRLSESMGKITVEGHGNTENVNEIVAAAIAAASKQRSILNIPPPPPPPHDTGRRIHTLHASIPPPPLACGKKKSLSSNFSAELLNQLFPSDPVPNVPDEKGKTKCNDSHDSRGNNSPSIHSFYSNSKSGTESIAQC
ncbi:hypothetical protein HJC23_005321 [Cyclotella cryptica]|uniref:Uncharacterized protein n=1 Tax=Cyclotella cryptica TaxID=29204 RepID=A0ABD3P8R5_9STRA